MSLDSLEIGGLYIILFIRGDPPAQNDFHWGLYLHRHRRRGGTKYHIRGQAGGWISDHGINAGVLKSFLLVGLFQIASVPTGLEDQVDEQFRRYDDSLNDIPGVTCRTWLFRVLEGLLQPIGGVTILKCEDLSLLQAEAMEFGNENSESAADNLQPRPVGRSKFL